MSERLNWFAVMWDCNGLEACMPLTHPADVTFDLLLGKTVKMSPNLNHWQLRAQANPQRFYEIYIISTDRDIERDDIVAMFESSPQTAADTIRRLGTEFYSNRRIQTPAII